MNEKGFDMLICQDPANMCWLTGFDGWSFYTPQAVIVHLNEDWPIWFGREQDAKSATITTDIPQSNIIAFSEPRFITKHSTPLMSFATILNIENGTKIELVLILMHIILQQGHTNIFVLVYLMLIYLIIRN